MAFSEDFEEYFDTDDFSVSATIRVASGEVFTVNGIFDNGYYEAAAGTMGIETLQPSFTTATRWLRDAADGDTVKIADVEYTIRDAKSDGTGITTLTLEVV